MTASYLIDMSKVPVPDVIEVLDFEQKFNELKALMLSLDPAYAQILQLESEPIVKLLQIAAYREMHLIARINDATRANILASATGNDLDAQASRFNIERLVAQEADPSTVPPTPLIKESDDALRRRVQLAFDGLNTAGSIDSYIYHALSSDGKVRDADAFSPHPAEITLTILSYIGDGSASQELLGSVRQFFGITADGLAKTAEPSKVRPQGDRVTVQTAEIINYEIKAQVVVLKGPTQGSVFDSSGSAAQDYVEQQHRLGAGVTISGIHRALHQPGVKNVIIQSPAADIPASRAQAAFCTGIVLELVTGELDE